ncbi:minichromosome maintenance domain-containing protein 2-like [Glandiceps talaboti]
MMDLFIYEETALLYLDKTAALERLKEKCSIYANTKQMRAAYNFVLVIDPAELAELNADFGNIVLNRISSATEVFQEVCFTAIQTLDLLPSVQYINQVLVHVRVSNIPDLPSYRLNYFDLWSCKAVKRLYKLKSKVCSISTVTQYTQAARYYCPISSCDGAMGHHYIRRHTPGASEFQTIRKDFMCMFCGFTLVEDVSCRLLADMIIVQLLPCEALERNEDIPTNIQSVTAFLRGDLVSDISIGKTYIVIATPTYKYQEATVFVALEVNNIFEETNQKHHLLTIPSTVQVLYNDRKSSAWSFVASLTYIFGGDITPPGTYFRLKLGMLLSLMESLQTSKKKGKLSKGLNLLAIGNDTAVIHRLLTYGSSFTRHHVHHTGMTSLFATVTKDNYGTGARVIDGGSLLLSSGGICTLGDLTYYKKDVRDRLLQGMYTDKYMIL